MSTAVKATRYHWRKADHRDDPVAVAASLVQAGETSFADDDVVAAVNAMDSAITGLQRLRRGGDTPNSQDDGEYDSSNE